MIYFLYFHYIKEVISEGTLVGVIAARKCIDRVLSLGLILTDAAAEPKAVVYERYESPS